MRVLSVVRSCVELSLDNFLAVDDVQSSGQRIETVDCPDADTLQVEDLRAFGLGGSGGGDVLNARSVAQIGRFHGRSDGRRQKRPRHRC